MVYISKPIRYLMIIGITYALLTYLQKVSRAILLKNYYRLDSSELEKLNLTDQEKKLLNNYENERKLAEQQVKLNSDVYADLRGGDGQLVVIGKNIVSTNIAYPGLKFDQYFQKFLFAMVDIAFAKYPEFGEFLKSGLIHFEIQLKDWFTKFVLGLVFAIFRLEAPTIAAFLFKASPYWHILPDENFLGNLREKLRSQDLRLDNTFDNFKCSEAFRTVNYMFVDTNLSEENIKYWLNDITCVNLRFINNEQYIQCISCLVALTLSAAFKHKNHNAVTAIYSKVVSLVNTGKMSKPIAMTYFEVLKSYTLPGQINNLPRLAAAAMEIEAFDLVKAQSAIEKMKQTFFLAAIRGGATIPFALPQNQISMDPFVVIHSYKLQNILKQKNQPKKFGKRFKISERLKRIKRSINISLLYVTMGLGIILTPISVHDFKQSGLCPTETTLVVRRRNYQTPSLILQKVKKVQELQIGDKILSISPLQKAEKLTIKTPKKVQHVRKHRVKAKMVKFSDLPRLPESFYSEDNSTFVQQNESSKIRIKTN